MASTTNAYAGAFDQDLYDRIPKAVWAAIAISRITCGGDLLDRDTLGGAEKYIIDEWDILHAAGIVPQGPRRSDSARYPMPPDGEN